MCQYLYWPEKHEFPLGGTLSANLFAPAAVMPLLTLAKRCRRLSPLLAAPAALLLTQGEAKAVLTYNIFESAGNVVAQANGSLNLTGAETLGTSIGCENEGIINSSIAVICTGFDVSLVTAYKVSGPLLPSTEALALIRPSSLGYPQFFGDPFLFLDLVLDLIRLTFPILPLSVAPHLTAKPSQVSASPQQA